MVQSNRLLQHCGVIWSPQCNIYVTHTRAHGYTHYHLFIFCLIRLSVSAGWTLAWLTDSRPAWHCRVVPAGAWAALVTAVKMPAYATRRAGSTISAAMAATAVWACDSPKVCVCWIVNSINTKKKHIEKTECLSVKINGAARSTEA